MGGWVKQEEDTYLPEWLRGQLHSVCVYCNSPMLNYYNDVGRCTNRKCSNEYCPGFIAARADFVRKMIGLDGAGFKTCLRDVKASKSKSALELLGYWGVKPTVTLGSFLRMHCFEGVDNEWEDICQSLGVYSLDELYDKYEGKWKPLLLEHKDMIYGNLTYVNLSGRPENMVKKGPRYVLTIMITGTPIGYSSKDAFVAELNYACRGLIVIKHQKTKRQTKVDALIREPGSTTRGKVDAAIKGGIPILTSEQFIGVLLQLMEKIKSE